MNPDPGPAIDNRGASRSAILVIFGAAGDLTRRKLVPALYDLFCDGWLKQGFAVIGVDREQLATDRFRQQLKEGVGSFARHQPDSHWDDFAGRISYLQADFTDPAAYTRLAALLQEQEQAFGGPATRVLYQATPPEVLEPLCQRLGAAGLAGGEALARTRIVAEKPFGRDLASAQAQSRALLSVFAEEQVYRIDHYLGKETVQNIMAFRFANGLFEHLWDRRYIDHVQITVAEDVGVEHRGGYYEHAGALRDMVQNHLMQVLCLIAMEPPVSLAADEVRNKKVDVLHAVRPLAGAAAHEQAVRGQYGAGRVGGKEVIAYRAEPGVAPDSHTETFAALKLWIDNWRWQDVPFYLRTGKRLPLRASEVSVHFRPVPHRPFPLAATPSWTPNRLVVGIQPEEGIHVRMQAKQPGQVLRLVPVDMHFTYREAFCAPSPDAYETLLLDVMMGDATLFMRADQVEAAWTVVEPVLQAWAAAGPPPVYPAGTWGPEEAEALLARDGRAFVPPTVLQGGCPEPKKSEAGSGSGP